MSDRDGMDLLGQIVMANVDAASRTTNALLEAKDEEILRLCRILVALDDVLESATVIDRKTEARLRKFDFEFRWAHQLLHDRSLDA